MFSLLLIENREHQWTVTFEKLELIWAVHKEAAAYATSAHLGAITRLPGRRSSEALQVTPANKYVHI